MRMADRLKGDLARGADPRLWLKQYPWATLAGATVAAFTAAAVAIPSKEQQALRRLARIEAALHPHRAGGDGNGASKRKRRMLARMLLRGARTLTPILISTISGAITGKMAQPSAEEVAVACDRAQQS
jgi:hypothetical protein